MSTLDELTRIGRELPESALREVLDFARFLQNRNAGSASTERAQRLLGALEVAVRLDPFAGLDGVQWQQAQRAERPLPGRDA